MNTNVINSIDDPRLDIFRNLKQTNRTRYDNLFVVEGATNTRRLLHSEFGVQSILVAVHRFDEFASVVPSEIPIYTISKAMASELVGFKFHLGILAAGYRQQPPQLTTVLPKSGASLVLLCDHVIDQQNVGMIIRIGAAFGADAIVVGPGSADPFSRRVIKVSMGNGLFTPVVESTTIADTMAELRAMNYEICATVLSEDAEELSSESFASRSVIVMGNESRGICDDIRNTCDRRLTISMLNGTDSINVAIATGIFSHSYRSQFPKIPSQPSPPLS